MPAEIIPFNRRHCNGRESVYVQSKNTEFPCSAHERAATRNEIMLRTKYHRTAVLLGRAFVKGAFPTADAAFDHARNSLELALRLPT